AVAGSMHSARLRRHPPAVGGRPRAAAPRRRQPYPMTTAVPVSPAHEAALATPPPPRWARWAVHAVPLVALPSSLWRLAVVRSGDVRRGGDHRSRGRQRRFDGTRPCLET